GFGAEYAEAAAVEDVVERHSALPHSAATLKFAELHVLEARETVQLDIAPAANETQVKLAFVAAQEVHVLALALQRVVLRERYEHAPAARDAEIPGARGRTGVQVEGGVLAQLRAVEFFQFVADDRGKPLGFCRSRRASQLRTRLTRAARLP